MPTQTQDLTCAPEIWPTIVWNIIICYMSTPVEDIYAGIWGKPTFFFCLTPTIQFFYSIDQSVPFLDATKWKIAFLKSLTWEITRFYCQSWRARLSTLTGIVKLKIWIHIYQAEHVCGEAQVKSILFQSERLVRLMILSSLTAFSCDPVQIYWLLWKGVYLKKVM